MNSIIPADIRASGAVTLEERSCQTVENARESLRIMQERGWTTAIVVAEAWHARRVRATFRKQWRNSGCTAYVLKSWGSFGDGGPTDPHSSFFRFFLYELGAAAWYRLKGCA